jgi:hypothetical protein
VNAGFVLSSTDTAISLKDMMRAARLFRSLSALTFTTALFSAGVQATAFETRVQLRSIPIPTVVARNKRSWRLVSVSLGVHNRDIGQILCNRAPIVFDVLNGVLSNQLPPGAKTIKILKSLEGILLAKINKTLKYDFVSSVRLEMGSRNTPNRRTPHGCWVLR